MNSYQQLKKQFEAMSSMLDEHNELSKQYKKMEEAINTMSKVNIDLVSAVNEMGKYYNNVVNKHYRL